MYVCERPSLLLPPPSIISSTQKDTQKDSPQTAPANETTWSTSCILREVDAIEHIRTEDMSAAAATLEEGDLESNAGPSPAPPEKSSKEVDHEKSKSKEDQRRCRFVSPVFLVVLFVILVLAITLSVIYGTVGATTHQRLRQTRRTLHRKLPALPSPKLFAPARGSK